MKNRSAKPAKRVYREPAKAKPIIEMSEEEKIKLGYRNNYVVTPDFSKDETEREKWKKVHSSAKGPRGGGSSGTKKTEPLANLVVHIAPNNSEHYKSTHCFKAKESEIGRILHTFFSNDTITKMFYRGQPLERQSA